MKKTLHRPIPEVLKDALPKIKDDELHTAIRTLIAWYDNGCPSKDAASLILDDTCDICNMNDAHDPHYGNPYVYHDPEGKAPCEVKIIT